MGVKRNTFVNRFRFMASNGGGGGSFYPFQHMEEERSSLAPSRTLYRDNNLYSAVLYISNAPKIVLIITEPVNA